MDCGAPKYYQLKRFHCPYHHSPFYVQFIQCHGIDSGSNQEVVAAGTSGVISEASSWISSCKKAINHVKLRQSCHVIDRDLIRVKFSGSVVVHAFFFIQVVIPSDSGRSQNGFICGYLSDLESRLRKRANMNLCSLTRISLYFYKK